MQRTWTTAAILSLCAAVGGVTLALETRAPATPAAPDPAPPRQVTQPSRTPEPPPHHFALPPPPLPPEPVVATGEWTTGIVGCDAYIRAVEQFIECDKVPVESRLATRDGVDAMKNGWPSAGSMPLNALRAADDACWQAADGLSQGATAMGCTIHVSQRPAR